MKLTSSINNENGTALIITLFLLVLLTLLGMAATTTSTIEIKIADNERDYKVNFYKAESAALQAAVTMENENDPNKEMKGFGPTLGPSGENWLRSYSDSNLPDMTDLSTWDDLTDTNKSGSWQPSQKNTPPPPLGGTDANGKIVTAFAAKFIGIGPGDSLMMKPTDRKYSFVIYGYSQTGDGLALIEVGYKRKF